MRLCITEKPSVAADIARILGAPTRRDGYYEGNGYCVTWTYGHLCCLKEPDDYTERWKRWSLGTLPMIPERFGIKLIDDKGIERQFSVIKTLTEKAEAIINCGDAGQEGELIQRWVMQKAGVHCPVYRLWISSLTDDAIKTGFKELHPDTDYLNLYYAGMSRAIGDWILGMNATRLYTLKYADTPGVVLSVGRVQTPTLALIVERHIAIRDFVPEPYWELRTVYRDATFNATAGRYKTAEEAQHVLEEIKDRPFVIDDVSEKRGREAPQRLFDLTSLQVECNRQWGWSADTTLRLIQSLYEKKVTTYPRVDTTYLPDDVYPRIPEILRKMTPYAAISAPVLAARIPKSRKIFDNSKITDHHAIIPTGESPKALVGDERPLYHLIAMRFIAAFYPDCVFNTTTVLGSVDRHGFKATGKVIVDPGWRILYKGEKTTGEDSILPPFTVGESGPHVPSVTQRTTQPPKPYTEGTLLRAMETAGRTVDDEALREAMKENGIGRPSTRAAIIETLFRRGYIRRERRNIVATDAGIALIDTIHDPLIKSAKLTGIWENRLRRIEQGTFSAAEFLSELKEMVRQIVINVFNDNSGRHIATEQETAPKAKTAGTAPKAKTAAKSKTAKGTTAKTATRTATKAKAKTAAKSKSRTTVKRLEDITCPLCHRGHILKGRTAYGCSEYRAGCTLRLNFADYPETLQPDQLAARIAAAYR